MVDNDKASKIGFLVFVRYASDIYVVTRSPCICRSLPPVSFVLCHARFRLHVTLYPSSCHADEETDPSELLAIQRLRERVEESMKKRLLAGAAFTTWFVVWDTLWSSAQGPQIPNHPLE